MSESLSATEREIIDALATVLAKEAPLSQTLHASGNAAGYDRDQLRTLAELGFFGATSSSGVGGLGLRDRLLGEFCVEAGRVLLGGPWLEQILAVALLDNVEVVPLVDELIAGATFVSLPLGHPTWRNPPAARIADSMVTVRAGRCELGFANGADWWLLPVRDETDGSLALVRVDVAADRCTALRAWSDIWQSASIDLDGAIGTVIARLDSRSVDAHLQLTARLLACLAVGSTEALLSLSTAFLQHREQFGRPLGTFQALQHKMADVFIELEHTRCLVRATFDPPTAIDLVVLTAMAKVAADRMAVRSAETALQVHGGLGFTWELPIHHYLKESLRWRTLPQPTSSYRDQLRSALLEVAS